MTIFVYPVSIVWDLSDERQGKWCTQQLVFRPWGIATVLMNTVLNKERV